MCLNLIASPVQADAAGNNDAARKSNRNDAREVTQLTSQFGERKFTSDRSLFGNDYEVRHIDFILHRLFHELSDENFVPRPRLSKKPC